MASEVTLRRHSKRELIAMAERGLAVQEELWRLQAQHEVRGEIVAEQADQLAACRDEIARLAAALDAREREVAGLRGWLAKFDITEDGEVLDECGDPFPDDFICNVGMRAAGFKELHAALAAPPQRPVTGEGA